MAKEIERKFLLKNIPDELIKGVEPTHIRQGYLVMDECRELRVRNMDSRFVLTSKSGHGLVRDENEEEIGKAVFDLIWPFTEGRRIEKLRYTIQQQGLNFEFDVYSGTLDELLVLEIEFDSVETAQGFAMPDYCQSEVTDNSRYKNANLASEGLP